MIRKELENILKNLRLEIGVYTNGYNLIEESEYLNINDIDFKEVDSEIISESRWSVCKRVVFKIANQYYIAVEWDDPATEMQDGQPTDCYIEEVEPYEQTVIKYKRV